MIKLLKSSWISKVFMFIFMILTACFATMEHRGLFNPWYSFIFMVLMFLSLLWSVWVAKDR